MIPSRRMRITTAVVALLLAVSGCTSATAPVQAVGTVKVPTRNVTVPTIATPIVDLDAGFGPVSTATTNTTATTYQVGGSIRLVSVEVSEGQAVRAGQTIAVLDQTPARRAEQVAVADRAAASAQVGLLDQAIADTYSAARTLAANRHTVTDAIATINHTLADLKKAEPQLRSARADLVAKRDQAEYLLAHYPPVPTPGVPSKDELRALISQLSAGIASIDAKLAQIATARPKLTRGLAKARTGLAKLDSASAKLTDARAQLRDLRDLARIAAATADIPVELARVQLALSTITAPSDGVVTMIAAAGQQLMPGSTVARIDAGGTTKVTAWLSPSQAMKVCVNDTADIAGDWMAAGTSAPATLTWVSPTFDYPPSSTTTDQTHLTRAVQVELSTQTSLPAGVPVEITINGCHPTAGTTEQDR